MFRLVKSGYQFTQKLEGMFNDMRLSADTMKSFERHLVKVEVSPNRPSHRPRPRPGTDQDMVTCQPLGYDISVQVLTSTFWPGESIQQTCNLPAILVRGTSTYEKFYHSRHSGRRLTWQASLGSADIKVQFRNRVHELNVSTYCAVILLMFEDLEEGEELGWEVSVWCTCDDPTLQTLFLKHLTLDQDIKKSTQIPPPDLSRALQSLSCGKYRVLTKSPKSRDVATTDRFSFNAGFTCPLAKIKIQTIVGKVESNSERAETQEKVDEERRHQIEVRLGHSFSAYSHHSSILTRHAIP
jgi:cullin 3